MRKDSLPSPGLLSMGINLQGTAARAISAIEIAAQYSGGKTSMAYQLDQFFAACRTALTAFIDVIVPTILTMLVVKDVPLEIRLAASEGLDPKFVPAGTAFAITGTARTVSAVRIDGPYVYLTLSAPLATGNPVSVAYTQPGAASNLRDLSGNLLASYIATAATNQLV
jgi:Putative flagellar system-associated repeat